MLMRTLSVLALLSIVAAGAAVTYRVATADPAVDNVPRVFPYRGSIELDGIPYSGSMDMHFYLYETPTGGTSLWDEAHTVNVYSGDFAVMLGTVNDLTTAVLETEPLYVEIHIDDGTTMVTLANRQQLGTTPYAMWAANIAPNSVTSTSIVDGTITADDIGAGAVGSSEVANNSLTADDLAADSVGASEISAGAVGSSEISDGSVTSTDIANNTITRTDVSGEIAVYTPATACGGGDITLDDDCSSLVCGLCFNGGTPRNVYLSCDNSCPRNGQTCNSSANTSARSCSNTVRGYLLAP